MPWKQSLIISIILRITLLLHVFLYTAVLFVTGSYFHFPSSKISFPVPIGKKRANAFNLLLFIAGFALFFCFQERKNTKSRWNYYSYMGRWMNCWTLWKKSFRWQTVQFHTTGIVSHREIAWTNIWLSPDDGSDACFWPGSWCRDPGAHHPAYIDMGYINEASIGQWSHITEREFSQILEQLILANIIAMNYQSARLYINNLKAIALQKESNSLWKIQAGGIFRKLTPGEGKKKNHAFRRFCCKQELTQLDLIHLLQNKDNKMAYEYLQAYFLLKTTLHPLFNFCRWGKNTSIRICLLYFRKHCRFIPSSFEEGKRTAQTQTGQQYH